MSESISSPTTLNLMSAFARALAHQMRTPLSVVANDLSYYRSAIPEKDIERTLRKCREMAIILKRACIDAGTSEDRVWQPLESLLPEDTTASSVNVKASPLRMQSIIDNIVDLFGVPESVTAYQQTLKFKFEENEESWGSAGEANSLTDFVFYELSRDDLAAPLTDALLLAEDTKLRIYQDKGLNLIISWRTDDERISSTPGR